MERFFVMHNAPIYLGRCGENEVREIVFDLSVWQSQFGEGTVQLMAKRSGEDTMYPVPLVLEEDKAIWLVTDADTAIPGRAGECELSYMPTETAMAKSEVWATFVLPSMDGDVSEPPSGGEAYIDRLRAELAQQLVLAKEVEQNRDTAVNAADEAKAEALAAQMEADRAEAFNNSVLPAAEQAAEQAKTYARQAETSVNTSAQNAAAALASADRAKTEADRAQAIAGGGVLSFNGRGGHIEPQDGDYTAEMVGARPDTWMPSAADVGAAPAALVSAEYTVTTLDELYSTLNTVISSMSNGTAKFVRVILNKSFAPFYGGTYLMKIHRHLATYSQVTAESYASTANGSSTVFYNSTDAGTWQEWVQGLNSKNFSNYAAPAGLADTLHVYVDATNGNDDTGTGTRSKPFLTVQKAVDSFPKDLNGSTAYVELCGDDSTVYPGDVLVRGFNNGTFCIHAFDNSFKPTIEGTVTLNYNTYAYFANVKVRGQIMTSHGGHTYLESCVVESEEPSAVTASYHSFVNLKACTLSATGSGNYRGAIQSSASIISAADVVIAEGTKIGLAAMYGGLVFASNCTNNASTATTAYHAKIYV